MVEIVKVNQIRVGDGIYLVDEVKSSEEFASGLVKVFQKKVVWQNQSEYFCFLVTDYRSETGGWKLIKLTDGEVVVRIDNSEKSKNKINFI